MIRSAFNSSYRSKLLSSYSQFGNRSLSAQAAVSFKRSDEEYANAIPFDEIPGPSKFELLRSFMPGGKFHNTSIIDIQKSMRKEYGDFYKMPGLFGQNTLVTTFDPVDVEYIHRTEGTYPFRRGLQTMNHYRQNLRKDVFSNVGLVVS